MAEHDALLATTCQLHLVELDPDHEWDVFAGYPHGDSVHPHVIRGARLGPGTQPFVTIYAAAPRYPEEAEHLGRVAAVAFHRYGQDHDNPQLVVDRAARLDVLYRQAGWAALCGH